MEISPDPPLPSRSRASPATGPADPPAAGAAPDPRGARATLTPRRVALAAALLAVILSAPTLGYDFVYDDVGVIVAREALWTGGVLDVLAEPYWPRERSGALWRPLTMALFSAQWSLGDGNPAVFHATNVVLYAGVSGLVALLAALLLTPAAGLVAGLLFAAHPVHVEVTANVVGQSELLSAAAYLGVLLLVWRSGRSPPPAGPSLPVLLGAGLLTLLGMAAKEHVVTLPGAVVLLWWLAARKGGEALPALARRQATILVAVVLAIVVYLGARFILRGEFADSGGVAPGLDPDSALGRLIVMLPVSLHWLRLLFWPLHLSADYGPEFVPVRSAPGWIHAAAAASWAVVLGAAWHLRTRIPAVAVGTGLFLVAISIASNVVVPLEVRLAERFLFLPSVGWAVAMGGLAVAVGSRAYPGRLAVTAVVAVVTVAFSLRTLDRNPAWSHNDPFFARMEEDAPGTFRISWIKAEQALLRGDSARGEFFLREAVDRNPWNPTLAEHLGQLMLDSGRPGEAIPRFIQALEWDPQRRSALEGLAVSLVRSGRGVEALRWIGWLEELHGETPLTTVLRVEALRLAGRFRESVQVAERGLRERPEDWNLHVMAAESARLGGLCEAALRHVQEGMDRAPREGREALLAIRTSILQGEIECTS